MRDDPITDALGRHRFFGDLSVTHRRTLAACATEVEFDVGDWLFRTDDPADKCYAVLTGSAVVELESGDDSHVIDTAAEGDAVGWSWLFPPYQAHFDVRVTAPMRALVLDGVTLRLCCDEDVSLGYELTKRLAALMERRLEAMRGGSPPSSYGTRGRSHRHGQADTAKRPSGGK
jgi:CRP-like cAMP-binding protein